MSELKEKEAKSLGCDLCKTSYNSEKDLKEHLWSLIHHTKIEDQKRNSTHSCTLCLNVCKTIPEYRKHLLNARHKKALEKFNRAAEDGKDYVFSDSEREDYADRPNNQYTCMDNNQSDRTHPWWSRRTETHTNQPPPFWNIPPWQRPHSQRDFIFSSQNIGSNGRFNEDRRGRTNSYKHNHMTNTHHRYEDDEEKNKNVRGVNSEQKSKHTSSDVDRHTGSRKSGSVNFRNSKEEGSSGEFENPFWHSTGDWQPSMPPPLMMMQPWQNNDAYFNYQNYGETSGYAYNRDFGRYHGNNWNKNYWKNNGDFYGNSGYDYEYNDDDDSQENYENGADDNTEPSDDLYTSFNEQEKLMEPVMDRRYNCSNNKSLTVGSTNRKRHSDGKGCKRPSKLRYNESRNYKNSSSTSISASTKSNKLVTTQKFKQKNVKSPKKKLNKKLNSLAQKKMDVSRKDKSRSKSVSSSKSLSLSSCNTKSTPQNMPVPTGKKQASPIVTLLNAPSTFESRKRSSSIVSPLKDPQSPLISPDTHTISGIDAGSHISDTISSPAPIPDCNIKNKYSVKERNPNKPNPNIPIKSLTVKSGTSNKNDSGHRFLKPKSLLKRNSPKVRPVKDSVKISTSISSDNKDTKSNKSEVEASVVSEALVSSSSSQSHDDDIIIVDPKPQIRQGTSRQNSGEPSTTIDIDAASCSKDHSSDSSKARTVHDLCSPSRREGKTANEQPADKPQKALAKETLLKLVNSPRSRKERMQLATMLRDHAQSHNRLDSSRIRSDDLDIEQVKHDFNSLCESFGGSRNNLPSIKIEDLTPEIQLQIAQLIEDDSELSVDVQSMLTNTIEEKSNKDGSVVHVDVDDNKTAETKQDDKTCIQSTVKSEPEWLKKSKKGDPVIDKLHCSTTQPPAMSIDSPSILPESTITLTTPQSSPEATPSTNKQSMATSSSTIANRPPTTHPNFYPHPYFPGNYPYPPFPPHGFPPFHQPMQFPNQPPNMFNPSFNSMSMPGFNMFPSMGNHYRPMPENMPLAPHTSNHEDQSHRMSPVQASTSENNDKLLSPHQSSNLLAIKSPVKVETPRKEKIYQTTATSPIKFDSEEPSEMQDILAFDDTTPPSAEQRSVMKVLISLSSKEEKIQSHLESVDSTEDQLNQTLKKTMQQLNDCREKRKRLLDEQKAIHIKKTKVLTDFIKDDVDRDDVTGVNHRVSSCDIGVQISYPLTSSPFVEQQLSLTTTEISHDSVPKTEPMFSPRSLVSYNSHDSDFTNSDRTSSQSSNNNNEVIVESDCSSGDINMDFIRMSNELGSEDETMATDDQIKTEAVEESCSSDVETSSSETVAVVSLQSTCESPFEKIQKMSSPNTSIRFENVHDKIIFSPSKHVSPAITTKSNQPGNLMMSTIGDRTSEKDIFLSPVKKEKCESSPECESKTFRKRSVSESDVDNKGDISPSICGRSIKYLGAITGSPDRASIIKQIAANFAGVTSVSCVRVNQQTTPNKPTAEHKENVEQVNPITTSCDSVNNFQHSASIDSTESSGDLRNCSIILEKLEMELKNSEAKPMENQVIDDACTCTSVLSPKASTMSPVNKNYSPQKTEPLPSTSMSNDNCVVIDSSSESTFDEENIPLASIKQKLQSQQSELSTLSMEFSETDSDEDDMELAKGYEDYFQFLETSESDSKPDENSSHVSTKQPHTKQPFDGPKNSVCGLKIIKNDVFVCYKDYGVRRYSLQSGELMKEYNTEGNIIQCMTIGTTRTGETRLYMAGPALCILAYEIEESSPMCTIDVLEEVKCLHSDYGHVYGGLSNGMLEVIRLQANKKIDTYQSDDQCIHCITSAREGGFKLLCVSSQDATITVYDAFSGLPVRVLEGHSKTAFSVRVTMNKVYSGSGDKTVMVHDLHTGDLEHVYKDHKGMVTSIYVDGGLLFSASYDRFVRCYDTENQTLKCMYYGAGHSVVSRLVVHDGKLYTGNRDGEISVIHINHQQVWPCQCDNCTHIFGVKDHLLHHVLTDHLTPNSFMTKCTWRGCKQWFSTQRESKNVESHMLNHLQSLDTTTD